MCYGFAIHCDFPKVYCAVWLVSFLITPERFFVLFCFIFFSTTDFPDVLRVGDSYSYSYLPAEDTGVESESDQEYAWLQSILVPLVLFASLSRLGLREAKRAMGMRMDFNQKGVLNKQTSRIAAGFSQLVPKGRASRTPGFLAAVFFRSRFSFASSSVNLEKEKLLLARIDRIKSQLRSSVHILNE